MIEIFIYTHINILLPVHSRKLQKSSIRTTVIRNRKSSLLQGFARQAEVKSKHPSDTQDVACWQQRCHSPNVDCPLAAISKQPVERKGTGWYLHRRAGCGNVLVSPFSPSKIGVLLPCYNDKPSFRTRQQSKFLRDFQSCPANRNVQVQIWGWHTAIWSFKSRLYKVATIQVYGPLVAPYQTTNLLDFIKPESPTTERKPGKPYQLGVHSASPLILGYSMFQLDSSRMRSTRGGVVLRRKGLASGVC